MSFISLMGIISLLIVGTFGYFEKESMKKIGIKPTLVYITHGWTIVFIFIAVILLWKVGPGIWVGMMK